MMDHHHLVWAVARKEYREITCRRSALLYPATLVALFVLSTVMMGRVMIRTGNLPVYNLVSEAALTNYFVAVFMLCLLPLLPFAFQKEKLTGTIESLLASPAGPRTIWIGKAAFLFLWAYACALTYLVVSAGIFRWQANALGLNNPFTTVTIVFLMLSPVVCAALALLVSGMSMIANPRLVSFLSGIAVIGFIMITSAKMRSAISTDLRLPALAVTSAVALVVCKALAPKLTRERILIGGK